MPNWKSKFNQRRLKLSDQSAPPKEPETLDEIRKEYAKLCTLHGDLRYRAIISTSEADELVIKMRALNQKAFELQKTQAPEVLPPESTPQEVA